MAADSLDRTADAWLLWTEPARAAGLHQAWRGLLDVDDQARAARLRPPHARERWVLAHGLLRQVLSRYAPVEPTAWRFDRDDHGRPWIASPDSPGLFFSLSACPGLAAVLVSDQPRCGIDVERVGRARAPLTTARGAFTPSEQAELAATAPTRRDLVFARHWTLKEAWAKAMGRGLDLPVERVGFSVAQDGAVTMALPPDLGEASAWSLTLTQPGPDHVLAAAMGAGARRRLVLHSWSTGPGGAEQSSASSPGPEGDGA